MSVLLRRAHNAKSPKDRHDTAYFAWEVSVRLAAAARPPADVTKLARGSVGTWVGALTLSESALDAPPLLAALALFSEVGQGKRATPKSVTAKKLLGVLPGYRNKVIGHGSAREASFYDESASVLIEALEAAWAEHVFLPKGSRLVYAESVELDPDGLRRARLLELMGDVGRVVDPRGTAGVPAAMLPQQLYLKEGDRYRSLHPWALFRQEEFRERVFFFNGLGRRAEVLDYASGDTLRGGHLEEAFAGAEAALFALFDQQRAEEEVPAEEDPNRFGGYRLLGKLGEGGMGVVYLAEQESLGRLVALKMLPRDLAEDAVALSRFRREVAALSRCDHPNVIKILASGEARGVPYYAMEYVEGSDLSRVAKALGTSQDFQSAVSTASEQLRNERTELFDGLPAVPRVPPRDVVQRPKDRYRQLAEALRDAARGVEHLHEAGIVHRDLKPGNLMVTATDHRVVVMDLGLAMVSDATRSITRDKSQVLGTLRYMPPEQLQRNLLQVDRRADVYSLGATFYELLTDRPFFDGDTEVRLIEQVLKEQPVPPERANPKVPPDLATIVRKATEKDANLRYDTAAALAEDVEAWLEGRPIAARPPTLWYLLRLAVRRNKAIAATIAAALLVVVVGSALFMLSLDRARRGAEDAQEAETAARIEAESERNMKAAALTDAERERNAKAAALERARSWGLVGASLESVSEDPMLALLLARQAVRADKNPRTLRRLRQALAASHVHAVLRGHTAAITSIEFRVSGDQVLTVSKDGTARVWSADGSERAVLRAQARDVSSAKFSPSANQVLTAQTDNTARLWSLDGEELAACRGHDGAIELAVFSPSGKQILTRSADKTARLWDLRGAELAVFGGPEGTVVSAAFAPTGKHILTTSGDGTVWLWDLRGQTIAVVRSSGTTVGRAVFSPSGEQVLVAYMDGQVRIFDLGGETIARAKIPDADLNRDLVTADFSPSGDEVLIRSTRAYRWRPADNRGLHWRPLSRHPFAGCSSAVFSPSGKHVLLISPPPMGGLGVAELCGASGVQLGQDAVTRAKFSASGKHVVTVSPGKAVRLWDLQGREIAVLSGHEKRVTSVAFPPTPYSSSLGEPVATGSEDGLVVIWDPSAEVRTLKGVRRAEFSPSGGQILATCTNAVARIWDLAGCELARFGDELPAMSRRLFGIGLASFSPSGRYVVTGTIVRGTPLARRRLWLWESSGGTPIKLEHLGSFHKAVFSPSHTHLLVVQALYGAGLWDLQGHRVAEFGSSAHRDAEFSPSGKLVLTTGGTRDVYDRAARLWDLAGHELAVFGGFESPVGSASFSPSGKHVLTGSADRLARLWSLDGEERVVFRGHEGAVFHAEFAPSGGHVLTSSADGTARLWDLEGRELAVFRSPDDSDGSKVGVVSAHFSPNGEQVLTCFRDHTARLWSLQGKELVAFGGPGSVSSAQFSSSGQMVLTLAEDGTARIWDLKGDILDEYDRLLTGPIHSARFSPSGRRVLTVSHRDIARLWYVHPEDLLRQAGELSTRGFTPGEHERYAGLLGD